MFSLRATSKGAGYLILLLSVFSLTTLTACVKSGESLTASPTISVPESPETPERTYSIEAPPADEVLPLNLGSSGDINAERAQLKNRFKIPAQPHDAPPLPDWVLDSKKIAFPPLAAEHTKEGALEFAFYYITMVAYGANVGSSEITRSLESLECKDCRNRHVALWKIKQEGKWVRTGYPDHFKHGNLSSQIPEFEYSFGIVADLGFYKRGKSSKIEKIQENYKDNFGISLAWKNNGWYVVKLLNFELK
ncbi:hypothetical protein KRX54_04755 [Actinomycetaceae bacterium TAE3-ERU4]|nr:hypothetical protein [Actinomycetaceae bacterium TAE3-ERU4]